VEKKRSAGHSLSADCRGNPGGGRRPPRRQAGVPFRGVGPTALVLGAQALGPDAKKHGNQPSGKSRAGGAGGRFGAHLVFFSPLDPPHARWALIFGPWVFCCGPGAGAVGQRARSAGDEVEEWGKTRKGCVSSGTWHGDHSVLQGGKQTEHGPARFGEGLKLVAADRSGSTTTTAGRRFPAGGGQTQRGPRCSQNSDRLCGQEGSGGPRGAGAGLWFDQARGRPKRTWHHAGRVEKTPRTATCYNPGVPGRLEIQEARGAGPSGGSNQVSKQKVTSGKLF